MTALLADPIDLELASETDSERRELLLAAAARGHSPSGGPVLSRAEIQVLRKGAGRACDAVLTIRLLEWAVRSATPEQREAIDAGAAGVEAQFAELGAELTGANDIDGARALFEARQALRRALSTQAGGSVGAGAGTGAGSSGPELIIDECPPEEVDETPEARRKTERRKKLSPAALRAAQARATMRLRIILGSTLVVAVVAAWLLYPRPLPPTRVAPDSAKISSVLRLTDVHLVGSQVFAHSDAWSSLDPKAREQAMAEACQRVGALGLAGLTVFDDQAKRADSCTLIAGEIKASRASK